MCFLRFVCLFGCCSKRALKRTPQHICSPNGDGKRASKRCRRRVGSFASEHRHACMRSCLCVCISFRRVLGGWWCRFHFTRVVSPNAWNGVCRQRAAGAARRQAAHANQSWLWRGTLPNDNIKSDAWRHQYTTNQRQDKAERQI